MKHRYRGVWILNFIEKAINSFSFLIQWRDMGFFEPVAGLFRRRTWCRRCRNLPPVTVETSGMGSEWVVWSDTTGQDTTRCDTYTEWQWCNLSCKRRVDSILIRIRIYKKLGFFFFLSKMGIGLWALLLFTFIVKDDAFGAPWSLPLFHDLDFWSWSQDSQTHVCLVLIIIIISFFFYL